MSKYDLTLSDVTGARRRIAGFVKKTPLIRAEKLEELFNGAEIYLKCENFQYTGSFKVRGVANKMLSLSPAELAKGVTAASSGNHAQAVSYISGKLGAKACIVMPENAPKAKVAGAKGYGAEVVLCGFTGEDRDKKCNELIAEKGYSLVHSHMDPYVICGHGTVALDVYEEMGGDLDELVLPCGAGSLTSGAALAMTGLDKAVKVSAVEPAAVPRFTESIRAGKAVTVEMGDTIADGLRVSKAEDINYALIAEYVDDLMTIDEEHIRQAVKELALRGKIIAEPSACVGIAAALAGKIDTSAGRKIVFVISGGNVDASLYTELLNA